MGGVVEEGFLGVLDLKHALTVGGRMPQASGSSQLQKGLSL